MAEADDRPLLSLDPPLYADDFLPALWVPLTRAVRARRRLLTLGERLPARSWLEPSAAPGWNRRDQLAHVAASDGRYHDTLIAAMNDRPLTEFEPHPDRPGVKLALANRRALEALADVGVAELVERLRAGGERTLELLAALDEDHVLMSMGFRPNALSLTEALSDHDNGHADDIVNGPMMMSSR